MTGFIMRIEGGAAGGAPTRFVTDTPWTLPAPVTYFRFGSNSAPVDGVIDDAVVWDRVLSVSEIAQVYAMGMSASRSATRAAFRSRRSD